MPAEHENAPFNQQNELTVTSDCSTHLDTVVEEGADGESSCLSDGHIAVEGKTEELATEHAGTQVQVQVVMSLVQ